MTGSPHMKRIISLILIGQLFHVVVPAFEANAQGILCRAGARGIATEGHTTNKGQEKEEQKDGEKEQGALQEILCPFKYLIYFFWFSFVVIGTAVVFVADLSFGFTKKMTTRFIKWSDKKTKAIEGFFKKAGCPAEGTGSA